MFMSCYLFGLEFSERLQIDVMDLSQAGSFFKEKARFLQFSQYTVALSYLR